MITTLLVGFLPYLCFNEFIFSTVPSGLIPTKLYLVVLSLSCDSLEYTIAILLYPLFCTFNNDAIVSLVVTFSFASIYVFTPLSSIILSAFLFFLSSTVLLVSISAIFSIFSSSISNSLEIILNSSLSTSFNCNNPFLSNCCNFIFKSILLDNFSFNKI